MKKMVIGCDHGGLELKNEIIKHLEGRGIEKEELPEEDAAAVGEDLSE